MQRPYPPFDLTGIDGTLAPNTFTPAPDLIEWIVATFVAEGAPLVNEDHIHLRFATLAALWTNTPNSRGGRHIIGQAELMPPMAMGKWQKARAEQQIVDWFGEVPDFLLTFYAPTAAEMDDASFCALVEHELYHCGQERDRHGAPKFTADGRPKLAIRGHDIEQFVGVVVRYGAEAAGVTPMIDAAKGGPTVARATVAGACGTCLRAAA